MAERAVEDFSLSPQFGIYNGDIYLAIGAVRPVYNGKACGGIYGNSGIYMYIILF